MAEIRMPKLSDTMEEGTILEWRATDRSPVKAGDTIAEIASDKASFELEAVTDGILYLLAPNGSSHPIGTMIGRIVAVGAELSSSPEVAPNKAPDLPASAANPPLTRQSASELQSPVKRAKISPLARKLATELGVEIGEVVGSGPGGLVVKEDVLATKDHPHTSLPDGAAVPTKMQLAIAAKTAAAKAPVPHFYLGAELGMDSALEAVRTHMSSTPPGARVSITHLLIKACADTIVLNPGFNRTWSDGRFHTNQSVDIGFAVALSDGLVAPVIRSADQKSVPEIADDAARLVTRAREGTLRTGDLTGASITLSNLGMFGVDDFIAIINPPESAILAVGAIKERAVVRDGVVKPGPVLRVNLSCDHRVVYGLDAARFLEDFRWKVEHADTWAV